ncbi:MAG: glycosyltransferase family 4 protein [Bacteroidia bacterium]|nr:glycosyltransferase family 4 protein [Bacteroidia bacterium]HQV00312.1 glycosyltransferase family 4 protein [Bacteroidia bacterium]
MEVVFCTSGIFPESIGGIQRHSRLLIEALTAFNDIKLTVIHPHSKLQFTHLPAVNEIQIPFNHHAGYYLYNCYLYSQLVYEQLKNKPNAIIYSQGLCIWHKAHVFKNRLVFNPHGLEPFQALNKSDNYKLWPFRFVLKKVFKNCTYVVSLGGKLTKILEHAGVKSDKIIELPNATIVPNEIPLKQKGSPFTFLFVGRFAYNKGIDVLLQAISLLDKTQAAQTNFILVGTGPLYQQLKSKYALSNVQYVGFADDNALASYYKQSQAFVLPTLFEGMPTVVLEAMARALPVIVTDVGATAMLVDESNGYLIEKNNLNQLKEALIKMTSLSDEAYDKLSKQSFEKVKTNFSWQAVAQQHYSLFTSLNSQL